MDGDVDEGADAAGTRRPLTSLSVRILPSARQDIIDRYRWLAINAGLDVAERMGQAVDALIARLAAAPGIGSPVATSNPALAELRKARLATFESLLLFYSADDQRLDIVRLLHASQNWARLLNDDQSE